MDNRVKILIADGNEEFCEHLKEALGQVPGYEVAGVAADGVVAVNAETPAATKALYSSIRDAWLRFQKN